MFSFLQFLDVFRIDKSLCVTIDVSFFGKRTIAGTITKYMDGFQRPKVMMFPTKQHEIHLQKDRNMKSNELCRGLASCGRWGGGADWTSTDGEGLRKDTPAQLNSQMWCFHQFPARVSTYCVCL